MASLNKVMIIGNLGADPEMRFTANGDAMATFNVACNRRYQTREGEQREDTEWVRVVLWRRLAEIAGQYLSKGRQVYIEGRLQTRQWQDREGNTRYTTEVVGNEMVLLGSRGDGGGGGGGNWEDGPRDIGGGPDAGDLPFE
ncbi:MAG: single-stranded DNA-binding protein [Chloroflexi bacterium]|nr:single-stranded DNA-binding protein [Chloroflexota bacterium]MCY3695925.1 single-stranded DNA-binding protein [Chloroflexota bacterium]MYB22896.1 single-stranded DNA-binding protein [Chloroflexota bacterium]MYF80887.1 single-stranded DNA-binding protein [Chloroflexota bacterium]MYI04361.1 single-stranded DNA-binding protein [Chloroflexota bacterium]